MPPTLADRLIHILQAIDNIQTFLKGKTQADFESDLFLRLAVERSFEIISEASRRLPDEVKAQERQINWPEMAALGNRLRHAYHRVDVNLLWEIVERDLPPLKALPNVSCAKMRGISPFPCPLNRAAMASCELLAGRIMKRREFITLLGGAVAGWPLPLGAQTAPPAALRVASASPTPRGPNSFLPPFMQRMTELGYVDGQNFILDFDDLGGKAERYGAAMQELVGRKADVILAYGPEASLKAAVAATQTIPIVMVAIDYDPLTLGYITSLARPTGNVTGLYLQQIELAAKRIELLRDAFPAMKAATVFWDALSADQWQATKASADRLGLQFIGVELRDYPYGYEKALAQAPAEHRRFVIIMTSPFLARTASVWRNSRRGSASDPCPCFANTRSTAG